MEFLPSWFGLSKSTKHANRRMNRTEVCKQLKCSYLKAIILFVNHIRNSRNVVNSRILVTGIGENLAGLQRSDGALGFPRPAEIPSFFIRGDARHATLFAANKVGARHPSRALSEQGRQRLSTGRDHCI